MPKEFKPSAQQQAFFDWIDTGSGNAVLQAVAGAGKTTTLLEATRRMKGSVMFMAYGKAAAADIRTKADEKGCLRPDLRIGTCHSVGFKAWMYRAPKAQLDDKKVSHILKAIEDAPASPEEAAAVKACKGPISKLVGLGKSFLMGVKDPSNAQLTRQRDVGNYAVWLKLATHYGLFDDLPEGITPQQCVDVAAKAFRTSAAQCMDVIDYDDMIYAPLFYRCNFFKQDWVLGDEWQDANPARREMVRRMCGPNTRVVFVGDSRQDIFGFTGTGNDSLGRSAAEFSCTQLDLTITYRCPKAVVSYAHQWVSHIQAHPDAPEGSVTEFKLDDSGLPWFIQRVPEPTDAILCRYNKPLVETAFAMLREGIACKVEGRDIGKNLISLAQKWKVTTLEALDAKLETYLTRELAKAQAKEDDRKAQEVTDRVDTLRIFIKRCRAKGKHDVSCVVTDILALFEDNVAGVTTLASGHKSKGREWGRVYWLQTQLKTRRALKEWEATQEDNINYVICTRVEGQHGAGELVLVPEGIHSLKQKED